MVKKNFDKIICRKWHAVTSSIGRGHAVASPPDEPVEGQEEVAGRVGVGQPLRL